MRTVLGSQTTLHITNMIKGCSVSVVYWLNTKNFTWPTIMKLAHICKTVYIKYLSQHTKICSSCTPHPTLSLFSHPRWSVHRGTGSRHVWQSAQTGGFKRRIPGLSGVSGPQWSSAGSPQWRLVSQRADWAWMRRYTVPQIRAWLLQHKLQLQLQLQQPFLPAQCKQ